MKLDLATGRSVYATRRTSQYEPHATSTDFGSSWVSSGTVCAASIRCVAETQLVTPCSGFRSLVVALLDFDRCGCGSAGCNTLQARCNVRYRGDAADLVEAELAGAKSGIEAASKPKALLSIDSMTITMSETYVRFDPQLTQYLKHPLSIIIVTLDANQNDQYHTSKHHTFEPGGYQLLFRSHRKHHSHELNIYLHSFTTSPCTKQYPHQLRRHKPYRALKRLQGSFPGRLGVLVRFASQRSSRHLSGLQCSQTRVARRRRTFLQIRGPSLASRFQRME